MSRCVVLWAAAAVVLLLAAPVVAEEAEPEEPSAPEGAYDAAAPPRPLPDRTGPPTRLLERAWFAPADTLEERVAGSGGSVLSTAGSPIPIVNGSRSSAGAELPSATGRIPYPVSRSMPGAPSDNRSRRSSSRS